MHSSEAWTMPKAEKGVEYDTIMSPGPSNYRLVNVEVNHEKFPEWTIKGRYPDHTKLHDNPGPGTYRDTYNDSRNLKYSIRPRLDGIKDKVENPGPGTYNPNLIKSNDGVTIGKKFPPSKKKADVIPGPGNYNSKSTLDPRGYKITKSKHDRFDNSGNPIPGPGSYNINKKSDPPYKGKFPRSKRSGKKGLDVPGPGSYNAKHQWPDSEAHKIQRRPDIDYKSDVPGPGYYVTDSKRKTCNLNCLILLTLGPAFTIGTKLRGKSLDDGPAPNHYSARYSAVEDGPIGGYIGKSARRSKSVKSLLGPGLYNHTINFGMGPAITMGRRYDFSNKDFIPGVGQYNLRDERPKSAKSTMSRSERLQDFDNNVPGVGHYNLINDTGKKISFAKSTRDVGGIGAPKDAKSMPGPGNYHLPSWNDGNGVTILERFPERTAQNMPGPGMYDISLSSFKGVSYSFSGTDTIDPGLKERMNTPSAGEYTPKHDLLLQRIKGGVMMKSKRKPESASDNPGPGTYTVYDVNGNKKGLTIGEKHDIPNKMSTPGPAYYSGNA